MKKYLASVIVGMMIAILSPNISYSMIVPVKNNKPCTKKNEVVKVARTTYKCTLVGKKLVWRIQIVKPTASPTPKPTVTLVPTPTSTPTPKPTTTIDPAPTITPKPRNIGQAASDNFAEWAKKNESIKNNHFIIKNGDIPNDIFKGISSTEIKTANIFAKFISKDTYGYYGGEDKDWFYSHNKMVPPGNTSSICGAHPDGIAGCTNLINALFYRVPHNNFNANHITDALGAHEYFHMVQMELAGLSPFFDRKIPKWFEEGTAEFVGYSVSSIVNNVDYDSIVSNNKVFRDIDTDPYGSGRILVEFIVKEYGFQVIIDIYSDYKTNKNFEEVFKNRTGSSTSEVLKRFRNGL